MTDHYPIVPPARNPHHLTATLRDLVGVIPAWMDEGICAQVDPDAWFPDAGAPVDAKEVCAGCPVRLKCLQYALDNREHYGVWGGLSTAERERLLRRKGRAA